MFKVLPVDWNTRKPDFSTAIVYFPGWMPSKTYVPAVVVVVVHEMLVPSLVSVTLAAGTTAPDESFTKPVTRELTCETATTLNAHTNAKQRTNAPKERCLIASPKNSKVETVKVIPTYRMKVGAFYTRLRDGRPL